MEPVTPWKAPAEQLTQAAAALPAANVPGAQLAQDDDATAPVLARYAPAAQLVQPPDPDWDWKLPVAQFVQEVAPVDEATLPARHLRHPEAPVAA